MSKFLTKELDMILESITNTPERTNLTIQNIDLPDEWVKGLAEILPKTSISNLNLSGCNISDAAGKSLADVLPSTKVWELDLSGNPDISAETLTRCMEASIENYNKASVYEKCPGQYEGAVVASRANQGGYER